MSLDVPRENIWYLENVSRRFFRSCSSGNEREVFVDLPEPSKGVAYQWNGKGNEAS
jgi:hypothetical protein